jgi:hypothetical protein
MSDDLRQLARAAAGLAALKGGRPAARQALLAGEPWPAVGRAALHEAPVWLANCRDPAGLRRFADLAALTSMGAPFARSIDGAWLGALAAMAGAEALEAAAEAAPAVGSPLPPIDPRELAARGAALLAAALPARLAGPPAHPALAAAAADAVPAAWSCMA